ncbi:MAG: hypothetical protein ACJATV_001048 [Granulosicoccus sp.]|jgi:hypothetical protein
MNVGQIAASPYSMASSSAKTFFVHADNDFLSKLTVGQVIQAKVMRHHEGSRYSVEFNGREKIIDSANPLQPGQLIEGKVKSLGQQVEVERFETGKEIVDKRGATEHALLNPGKGLGGSKDVVANELKEHFASKKIVLNESEIYLIKGLMSKNEAANAIIASALAVKKTSVSLTKETITSVAKMLNPHKSDTSFNVMSDVAILDVDAGLPAELAQAHTVKNLAEQIKHYAFLSESEDLLQQQLSAESYSAAGNDFLGDGRHLAQWILNVQDDSSINHRLMHFPIWLGDKLVEIRMAFFDQNRPSKTIPSDDLFYKKIVFTVDLKKLGAVSVVATMYGQHMNLSLTSNNRNISTYMAEYTEMLKANISHIGWDLDQLEYATLNDSEYDGAAQAIVEHYINKDSVSRLL